jgi:RNA polymerase sigma factor (sigma-70 family)
MRSRPDIFFGIIRMREGRMSISGSVTVWLGRLKKGDEDALARLHARYWPRLVALARKRLQGVPGRAADEEDVAQKAFWCFYRSLQAGRLPRLENRHHLFAVLTHIIACEAINQIEHEQAEKRGGKQVQGASSLDLLAGREGGPEPAADSRTPLEEALLKDCYAHYVQGLPAKLRDVAELHLGGWTHREIARQLGCADRTVERKMVLILARWQEMAAASVDAE